MQAKEDIKAARTVLMQSAKIALITVRPPVATVLIVRQLGILYI